jgi:dTDP-4-dehydrorhamnose 3,5-epimerase
VPDLPYDRAAPDEYRLPPDTPEIPYDWSRRMG